MSYILTTRATRSHCDCSRRDVSLRWHHVGSVAEWTECDPYNPNLTPRDAGNLPRDMFSEQEFDDLKKELEDEFTRFGRVVKVWVAKKPAGFGE